MERLTFYDDNGRVVSRRGYEMALSRLAAYEDIGLTPEQILEIDKMYLEKCEEVNRLKERNIEIIAKMKSELERYYYLWNDSKEDSLYNEGRADAMQEALNIMRSDEK